MGFQISQDHLHFQMYFGRISIDSPSLFCLESNTTFTFKAKIASSGMDWSSEMSTFIRNNDEAILKSADKVRHQVFSDSFPTLSYVSDLGTVQ